MADIVYKPPFEASSADYPQKTAKIGWQELCFLYGSRIVASNTAPGNDEVSTLYTVNAGKILLLMTATLSIVSTSSSKRTSSMYIQTSGGDQSALSNMLHVQAFGNGSSATSISPTIPMLIQAGEKITIFNEDPLCITVGCITGFEVDLNLYRSIF